MYCGRRIHRAQPHDHGRDLPHHTRAHEEARAKASAKLRTGVYEPDTLYLLDAESTRLAAETAEADDMLATIDGL
jgi:hypothetical protein